MKILILSGYGISITVDGGRLTIQDGHDLDQQNPEKYVFRPKFIDLDTIIVEGDSGKISFEAIRWLTKMGVQLSVLNWDGRLLTTMYPLEYKRSDVRMAQYKAYESSQRVEFAKKIIDAKVKNSIIVLKWLGERYPEIAKANDERMKLINSNLALLPKANRIKDIMGIEGIIAHHYWDIVSLSFDKKWDFPGRANGKTLRPMGAIDPINALFNYGYSVLESQCWKAINANGLDPYVGFLHENNPSKAPLVYDLQEPFRWIVDVAVITGLEKGLFLKKDFIRTRNYNTRIWSTGIKKLMGEIVEQFSKSAKYKNYNREWANIIVEMAHNLSQYLTGKTKTLDFSNPSPQLTRDDSSAIRQQIKKISYSTWEKNGYSKGTLHYLKKNANSDRPFKIYNKGMQKLLRIN
jgi:CRISPR-associated protein Cas1